VRGTQEMVDHMGWVFRRPQLILLEVAWRWIFAVPFLVVCRRQIQKIAVLLPPDQAGLRHVDSANPWIASVQIGEAWGHYLPYVLHVLYWLAPLGGLAWALLAGIGRSVVLKRMEPGVRYRPLSLMGLYAGWLVLLGLTYWAWYGTIQWVAATYISPSGEADLVGYSIWAIFLSLGFFTLFAVISWPFSIAAILAMIEKRSAASAFAESFRLGKTFTAKLIEINLTMGIVKLMLIVLAMVFSAAPVPFAAEVGNGVLREAVMGSCIFYCVASDYFQVVRLKSFLEFWRIFRGAEQGIGSH